MGQGVNDGFVWLHNNALLTMLIDFYAISRVLMVFKRLKQTSSNLIILLQFDANDYFYIS